MAALTVAALVAGLVLAVLHAVGPTGDSADVNDVGGSVGTSASPTPAAAGASPRSTADAKDALAARPMPAVPESASRPGPVSDRDPGPPILLPRATVTGPAGVPTGFPRTPEGAMAQLAAIDQTALQSGSLSGARAVIAAWALPGGPTTTSWSGVQAMRALLNAAGLSGGGSPQLAVVLTPLMGQIKGSVGPDFVVPCVDFELDVTMQQTARGAIADCQRMVWHRDRWMIGPGEEPALAPSVWPGTDLAIGLGYRGLRHG
ncbi:hypothetical protein [Geodermatophilus chilensis]|uniref:hypothetical protein n=1 Tax=Geodermatophilus chilensis TaxID=2035835 RepID=UPI001E40B2C5|nr:hypothetical protein [Geodermatophilus chilensis]